MIFNIEEYNSSLNACNLSTIINVENFILKNSGTYSKTELWDSLPKDIRYQSYKVVIEFLLYCGKIRIENKKIFWCENQQIFDKNAYKAQNRMPTLTSLSNILDFVSKNSGTYSKTELWNELPKKIMYQTYKVAIEYLITSNLLTVESRKLILGGDLK